MPANRNYLASDGLGGIKDVALKIPGFDIKSLMGDCLLLVSAAVLIRISVVSLMKKHDTLNQF